MSSKIIPVVLIHKHGAKDDRYPLEAVKAQAAQSGNTVHLLDDSVISDYWEGAKRFAQYYVHLSTNHRDFELFCIQRWYVLAEWMQANEQDRVLYLDSDVLLFCNAEEQWRPFEGCALTLALGTSPATSYFTLQGLNAFLDYVDSIYVGQNSVLKEFYRIYTEMQAQSLAGGICDMTLFKFFKEQVRHVRVGEMTERHNGSTWDHNLNSGDDYFMLTTQGPKAIEWKRGQPYCRLQRDGGQLIRFNSLHFQGGAKKWIPEYLRRAHVS